MVSLHAQIPDRSKFDFQPRVTGRRQPLPAMRFSDALANRAEPLERRSAQKADFGVCNVEAIADSEFFKRDCGSDRPRCVAMVVRYVRHADQFYRQQTFGDAKLKGLGFTPFWVTVWATKRKDYIASNLHLGVLRAMKKYPGRKSYACMHVLFTNRPLDGTSGSAYIGGQCRRMVHDFHCEDCKNFLNGANDLFFGLCSKEENRAFVNTHDLQGKDRTADLFYSLH